MNNIEYLRDLPIPLFHTVYYKMTNEFLDKGETLLKERDDTDALYIVTTGTLEVFIELDGHKFIVDMLGKGSIICHRGVFTDDEMLVNIAAITPVYYLKLTEDQVDELRKQDAFFDARIGKYQHALMRKGTVYPLDYILPSTEKKQKKINQVTNILKNVVTNII